MSVLGGMGHRFCGGAAVAGALTAALLTGCSKSGGSGQSSVSSPPSSSAPAVSADKLLAQLPPAYAHADLQNGELHFHLCLSCHTIDKGGPDMTGPNLYGVFGRKVASRPEFGYSAALKDQTWTWDVAHLDGWIKDPRSYVPGTKMTFYGLRDDKDRLDTLAYLKVASSGAAP
ncbi:MAG: c-type cytochrome [Caulobacteraceae bacterium]